jgi:hypothetical protein
MTGTLPRHCSSLHDFKPGIRQNNIYKGRENPLKFNEEVLRFCRPRSPALFPSYIFRLTVSRLSLCRSSITASQIQL